MMFAMDGAVVESIYGMLVAQPGLASLVVLMANDGIFLLPLAVIVVWFVQGRTQPTRRRAVLAGCLAALVAFGIGLVLERTLARPRPFVATGIAPLIPHAADSSFPSDHTLVGVALVGLLAWRVPRMGLWLFGWAMLVGVARIGAALHYPSDILGSALLGLAIDGVAWLVVVRAIGFVPESIRRRLALEQPTPANR